MGIKVRVSREAPFVVKPKILTGLTRRSTPKDEVSNAKDLPEKSQLFLKKEKEYCVCALPTCLGKLDKRDARAYRKVGWWCCLRLCDKGGWLRRSIKRELRVRLKER